MLILLPVSFAFLFSSPSYNLGIEVFNKRLSVIFYALKLENCLTYFVRGDI